MNPLYLAMMQQQGQQPMPDSMPATTPLQLMPQQTASPSYTNPFDSGITKAIEGARTSIAVSQAQKQEAFGKSLAAFAAALSQPHQQYWGDNPRSAMMRQIGASLAPGIQTYNQAEDQARQENLGMAEYMVKLKSTQDEALRNLLKEQLDRQHQDDVLSETKRHHGAQEHKSNLLLQLKQDKLNKDMPQSMTIGGKEYSPIASKQEHRLFVNDKKNFGHILKELNSIQKDYKDFRTLTKDNLIDPQAPYYAGTIANEAKDLWGVMRGNLEQKKETAKRKALEARLGKFAVEMERKLKGGVLSEGMMKRFEKKGILPSLDDRPEVFEQKMSDLIKEISINEQAASQSLRTGLVITPLDIEEGSEGTSGENKPHAGLESLSTEDLMEELQALEGR